MPINNKVSVSTFQNADGSNFTTAGVERGISNGRGSLSFYGGMSTNFTKGSTGIVFDFKGNVNYTKDNANCDHPTVSGGARVRNIINGDTQAVYARLYPANVNIPVAQNAIFYMQPYAQAKINYKTGDTNTTFGVCTGVSQKVGKVSVFVEGQLYDVTKVNKSTVGVNGGISIPF